MKAGSEMSHGASTAWSQWPGTQARVCSGGMAGLGEGSAEAGVSLRRMPYSAPHPGPPHRSLAILQDPGHWSVYLKPKSPASGCGPTLQTFSQAQNLRDL